MNKPLEEPTVETRMAFKGQLVDLRVDTVRLTNGNIARREIVDHSDCVCIVPLDVAGKVILVRQYRKPVERFLLEVPAGSIDRGEDPHQAALRELREETGYKAKKLDLLSYFWTSPGFCTEGMYAFLATELEAGPHNPEADENIEVVEISLADIPQKISCGQIQDAKTIASLLLVLSKAGDP